MINVNFQPMNVNPSPEIPNLPEVLLIMNAEVCLLCTVWPLSLDNMLYCSLCPAPGPAPASPGSLLQQTLSNVVSAASSLAAAAGASGHSGRGLARLPSTTSNPDSDYV